MSEQVPGADIWRDNVTAPSILDPANATEIKTGLEQLADRTFYLAQLHLRAFDEDSRDDPGYTDVQTIDTLGSFVNVTTGRATLTIVAGDIIEITTMFNYRTTGLMTLAEIRHNLDLVGPVIGRRRIPLGTGLSVIHTSFHIAIGSASPGSNGLSSDRIIPTVLALGPPISSVKSASR